MLFRTETIRLGTIIDTGDMSFRVPSRKAEKLKAVLAFVVGRNIVTVRKFYLIVGKLSTMHLVIGPIVRLQTRSTYMDIKVAPTWNHPCLVSDSTI